MPFGLSNAAQMIQRFIDTVLRGLSPLPRRYRSRLSGRSRTSRTPEVAVRAFRRLQDARKPEQIRFYQGRSTIPRVYRERKRNEVEGRSFTVFTDHIPIV